MVPMPLKEAHVDVVSVLRERPTPYLQPLFEAILGPLTQDYLGPVRTRGTVFSMYGGRIIRPTVEAKNI